MENFVIFKGFVIIFVYLTVGNLLSDLLNLPIAGSVIGMLLLTFSLYIKIIKLEDVKASSDIILENMTLLYVPSGVGIMLYFGLLKSNILSLIIPSILSTFFVLAITGVIQQKLERGE